MGFRPEGEAASTYCVPGSESGTWWTVKVSGWWARPPHARKEQRSGMSRSPQQRARQVQRH